MMTRHLFVLPFGFALVASAWGGEFSVKDVPAEGRLDILDGGKIVGRYLYGRDRTTKQTTFDTAKPFLHVFDEEGKLPITKGAGGQLPHHRGIFIGWNKLTVNGRSEDLWHMPGTEQLHTGFTDQQIDEKGAAVTSLVSWKSKTGETLIEEKRTMAFRAAPAPAYAMIDFSTTLTAVAGEVKLDGDPEHAGLHFRAADELDKPKTKFLLPKENANATKDFDYPWVMESYFLRGKTYNVVYLNHPANPTHTKFSAYRDYGRFGAFFTGTLPKGESLTLKARFVISEGTMPDAGWIQKQANLFTGREDAVPVSTLKESTPFTTTPKPKAAPVPAPVPAN